MTDSDAREEVGLQHLVELRIRYAQSSVAVEYLLISGHICESVVVEGVSASQEVVVYVLDVRT